MKQIQSKIDHDSVQWATHLSQTHAEETLKKAMQYLQDLDKKKRLESAHCKHCYYIYNTRIGGAAMTSKACGVCARDMLFGSTATDPLCLDCGKTHELCIQCGGDLHMRVRRKWKDIPVVKVEND